MELTEEDIKKFQQIYKKRFGKSISKTEAKIQGEKLVNLMKLIYRPIR